MYKGAAKGEQFLNRSASESTKGSRKGFSLLGGGEDPLAHLTPHEKIGSLMAVARNLQKEIIECKERNNDPIRIKRLGKQLFEINSEINALRPKRGSGEEIVDFFIDICRRQMTKHQFKLVMDEAHDMYRAAIEKKK